MQAHKTVILSAVVAVALAGSLFAQGRPGGFGRPGQRPANAASAQRPAGPPQQMGAQQGGPGGAQMQTIMRFLIGEYLGLTEEQQASVAGLRRAAAPQMMELRQQIAQNMRSIREAAKNGESSDLLAEEHGRLVAEALKQQIALRTAIRASLNLTPEQEEKLDRVFDLFEQMRPEPGQFVPPEGVDALQY